MDGIRSVKGLGLWVGCSIRCWFLGGSRGHRAVVELWSHFVTDSHHTWLVWLRALHVSKFCNGSGVGRV